MKKKILMGLLSLLLIVCSCGEKKEKVQKPPTRVNTEVATTASSQTGQTYVGIVEENEGTSVSFTTMGVVRRILVKEGQRVGRGQLIAELDNTQARNVLAGAEAAMVQANDALQRYKQLHDNGSLPEVQWVEIQSKVAQAKSQLDLAKKNLADCRLIAPVSGIIGRKSVGTGETALPSQAVVNILDVNHVKVKVAIPETEIGRIHADTHSVIHVEAAGKQVSGGRIEKGVEADAMTHTYEVRIDVANSDGKLLPGMVADVRFPGLSGGPGSRGLSVPLTAVQRKADGSLFVWTVDEKNTAHRTTVTIGQTIGNRVVITSGAQSGTRVITEGYQKLSEGTQVTF